MKQKTIYVCDDDPGIIDVVNIVLSEAGYNVVTSRKSEGAVVQIKKLLPDLILLDLWMPGIGGKELIPIIKKDPKTAAIPIIVISASKDTKQVAESAGADGFLFKPFDISDLEGTVLQYLSATDGKE